MNTAAGSNGENMLNHKLYVWRALGNSWEQVRTFAREQGYQVTMAEVKVRVRKYLSEHEGEVAQPTPVRIMPVPLRRPFRRVGR